MPEPFADAEAEFCRLIGAFLMEFSQLETMIQARLAQAIELPEEFSTCTQSKFLELGIAVHRKPIARVPSRLALAEPRW
jgi:hypothetical protein